MKKKEKIRYSGTTAVEAAIVLPLLLLLTFGAIEYGWIFLKAQQITNAAREGARLAIRATTKDVGPVVTAVDNAMARANISDYDPPTIVPDGLANLATGTLITVKLAVPTEKVALIKGSYWPLPDKLGASVTMAREGP